MKTILKTYIFMLLTALLSTVHAAAEQPEILVDTVEITGTDSLLAREILPSLLLKKGGKINDGLMKYDLNTISDYHRNLGWWNASAKVVIDSSRAGQARITYRVDTGDQALFGRIVNEAADVPEMFSSDSVTSLYGQPFRRQLLEEKINGIIMAFSAEGYPNVTVVPSMTAVGDTVNISLKVIRGEPALIDTVIVRGLTRTKDYVIHRELASLIGKPAGTKTAAEARGLLGRLTFIQLQSQPVIEYGENGRGILAVSISEGGQGAFDGVLGYQPSEGGDSGEMIGKVDLDFVNIFGTGRSAGFRWENLGQDTEDLEIGLMEPWIFGLPYDVSGSFLQEERESRGYVKTTFGAGIGRHIGQLRVNGGFVYEKVSADTLSSSTALGVKLGATWQTLDNAMNPSRGIRYAADWSIVSKRMRFGSEKKSRIERTEFDLDHFIPTLPRQTAAVMLRYRHVNTPRDRLTLSDRYWLGGASSIRGHNENIFPAMRALWSSLEYRFLTGETSRVFLFIDTGYLENIEKTADGYDKKTETVTGYGFGIRLRSRAGVLGFDYGLEKEGGFGEGKLHVSMRTEF